MTNAVEIVGKRQMIREYNGQRVVTFKDIDDVHSRPDGTARKRFNENREHFVEGEDYFVRKTDEALNEYGIVAPNGLILITETGYLMLVKSFRDDLAWKVQRALVNNYFRKLECATVPAPAPVKTEPLKIRCRMTVTLDGDNANVRGLLNMLRAVPVTDVRIADLSIHEYVEQPVAVLSVPIPASLPAPVVQEKATPRDSHVSRIGYSQPFGAKKLATYLKKHHVSYADLAEKIGASNKAVAKWCAGVHKPGNEYRNRICDALEVKRGYFG